MEKTGLRRPLTPHVIARQRFAIAVADNDVAHALIERVSDLNRRRWLPVIEAVCDEFAPPDEIIRIDRIDLDLGRFAEHELGEVETRLGPALRSALRDAIGTRRGGTPMPAGNATVPIGIALIEAFGHYLLHGAWPYGGALDAGTMPAAILDRLIDTDAAALGAMLRRHRGSKALVHRLAVQMPRATLERLLARLDPASAAYVIAYLVDVRESHAVEPVAAMSPAELDAALWMVVLRDALHDTGLRANRKAFVAAMIDGLAQANGVATADLLRQLRVGLEHIHGIRLVPGSLLTIVSEIIDENRGRDATDPVTQVALLLADRPPIAGTAQARSLADAVGQTFATDARGARAMLLDHARTDAAKLLGQLEAVMPPGNIAALLMPGPIADPWRWLMSAADCTPAERTRLVEQAARASPSIPPAAFARAVIAQLARMRGVSVVVMRERVIGAASSEDRAAIRDLLAPQRIAALADAAVRRADALALVATLFDPAAPFDTAERVAALRRIVPRLTGVPAAVVRARIGSPIDAAALALLEATDRRTSERLLILLTPATDRPVLRDAIRAGASHVALVLERLGGTTCAGSAVDRRRPTADAGDAKALAALFGHRPPAAVALVGGSDAGRLFAEPGAAALLFGGFATAERSLATRLGKLLTGRRGRTAIPSATIVRAFALALASRDWRSGGEGFSAAWLGEVMRLASLSEQAAVRGLVEHQWRDANDNAPLPRGLGKPMVPSTPSPTGSIAWADALLRDRSAAALLRLRRALRDPSVRAALARRLPEAMLARLLAFAMPIAAADALRIAEQVAAARAGAGAGLPREPLWRALLQFAVDARADMAKLLALLLDDVPIANRLPIEASLLDGATGYRDRALHTALEQRRDARARRPIETKARTPIETSSADIFIGNAGIVLAGFFLPRFFSVLRLTEADPSGRARWRSPDAQARAVHLVQMLVDDRGDAPEPALALNKLLCGMTVAEPVTAAIEATDEERATCRLLLDTMIAHWPQMRGSSHAALRETFLQRDGRIGFRESGPAITVERKVVDVLLGSVGWNHAMIFNSWMPAPISVRW